MLEGVEAALIDQASRDHEEFRQLLEAHQGYENQLNRFNELTYLTSDQELERKRLQKLKLLGKDRMMAILSQYASS
jgi:uncharacterized protein YdcH (DUF465 family)